MAVDKLVDSTQLNADLTSVADAIRTKGGTSASLAFPAGFVSAVEAIETGGNIGGLSEMVDVEAQAISVPYMLMQMKKGNTAGGKFTPVTAYPNTETLLIDTGLTELHGFCLANTERAIGSTLSGVQSSIFMFAYINASGTFNMVGRPANGNGAAFFTGFGEQQQNVLKASAPLNGSLRFDGGKIYYAARYNRNANYQIIINNEEYEWLAW